MNEINIHWSSQLDKRNKQLKMKENCEKKKREIVELRKMKREIV